MASWQPSSSDALPGGESSHSGKVGAAAPAGTPRPSARTSTTTIHSAAAATLKEIDRRIPCPDPRRFIDDARPLLEARDICGLLRLLDQRYSQSQVCELLAGDDCDARKVAALALGLVGNNDSITLLVRHLRDADPVVNEMAEHALWSIWFRGGTPEANCRLLRGSEALNERNVELACEHFNAAIALCPDFAEAFNQRAMAHYIEERFCESLADCRRAVELMPPHFGAWAGMGHSHAHLGRLEEALRCYRRALAINPHLDCVAELIYELENGCADSCSLNEDEE